MNQFTLVACVQQKRAVPAAARELYVSPWFRFARAYAEQHGHWAIVSAKHYLIDPHQIVAPYDETLVGTSRVERELWAREVALRTLSRTVPGATVTLLAGARYAEFLAPRLAAYGRVVRLPLAGLGIGQQLHWLKEATSLTYVPTSLDL